METQFSPRDLVTAHLPDGRTVEGEFWSHPRADHACVIDWSPRYGVNAWGGRVRQAGRVFVTIVPGTIVHAMSVRPCQHAPRPGPEMRPAAYDPSCPIDGAVSA